MARKHKILKLHLSIERGASLIDYCLLVSLVVMISVGSVRLYGIAVTEPFCHAIGVLQTRDIGHSFFLIGGAVGERCSIEVNGNWWNPW